MNYCCCWVPRPYPSISGGQTRRNNSKSEWSRPSTPLTTLTATVQSAVPWRDSPCWPPAHQSTAAASRCSFEAYLLLSSEIKACSSKPIASCCFFRALVCRFPANLVARSNTDNCILLLMFARFVRLLSSGPWVWTWLGSLCPLKYSHCCCQLFNHAECALQRNYQVAPCWNFNLSFPSESTGPDKS